MEDGSPKEKDGPDGPEPGIAGGGAEGGTTAGSSTLATISAAGKDDERLYSEGHERLEGDFCPICTLPIPLPIGKHSTFNVCCMTVICGGCLVASQKRGVLDCPFCRAPYPDNDADELAMIQARVEKKDPNAIMALAQKYYFGTLGMQKDLRKAVELWTEAAELGSVEALFYLGFLYCNGGGCGVREDKAKGIHFFVKAAMQGHAVSRHNLGFHEAEKGNHDRAVRNLLISAKMGLKESVDTTKKLFINGQATKEQYAQALKGYQDATEEMKSHDRDEAKRLGVSK